MHELFVQDPKDRIILAADVSSEAELVELLKLAGPYVGTIKLGLEVMMAMGAPQAVACVRRMFPEMRIFLDPKLDDIPKTMAKAVAQIAKLGVWGFTVHASATMAGMRAAAEHKGDARMLGVTALTTMTEDDSQRIFRDSITNTVPRLAFEALEGGCDGLVCAPQELSLLSRQSRFDALIKVVPNVRPNWAVIAGDDQNKARGMTPKQAICQGGDKVMLVMGRPITHTYPGIDGGPAANIGRICNEIADALDDLGGR